MRLSQFFLTNGLAYKYLFGFWRINLMQNTIVSFDKNFVFQNFYIFEQAYYLNLSEFFIMQQDFFSVNDYYFRFFVINKFCSFYLLQELELRIETQKQTLQARDESIKKLLEMLQNKGMGEALLAIILSKIFLLVILTLYLII